MEKLKKALLYAGLKPEEFKAVLPDARLENQKLLPMYCTAAILVFAGLFCLSGILGVNYQENRWVYLGMLLVNLVLYFCSTLLIKRYSGLIDPLDICFIAALYEFAFYITLTHPNMPAVTLVALLLVIPYFFDYRPLYEIVITLFAAALYCKLAFVFKSYDLAMDDLWNVGFFALVACILSVVQARMKFRLMHQSRLNRYLSERDLLTGLRNRNAYERELTGYGERCLKSAACVYADVNGLHEMNNRQGHAAGDLMLQTVADAIKKYFGEDKSYRIGGDEFVSLQMDVPFEKIRQDVDRLQLEIKATGYDISCGIALHEKKDIDMTELVREAEKEMYKEKKEYYNEVRSYAIEFQ